MSQTTGKRPSGGTTKKPAQQKSGAQKSTAQQKNGAPVKKNTTAASQGRPQTQQRNTAAKTNPAAKAPAGKTASQTAAKPGARPASSTPARSAPTKSGAVRQPSGKPAAKSPVKATSSKSAPAKAAPTRSAQNTAAQMQRKSAQQGRAVQQSKAPSSRPVQNGKAAQKPQSRKAADLQKRKTRAAADAAAHVRGKNLTPKERTFDDSELRNSAAAAELDERRRQRIAQRRSGLYKTLYFISMAVAVLCLAFVLAVTILFHIDTITVNLGENVPYTQDEILSWCGIKPGENLLTIKTGESEKRITSNLPYIEKCTVRRVLPSTVEIDTEAATVMGVALTDGGQRVVLSTSGRALEVMHGTAPEGAPLINGLKLLRAELGSVVDTSRPDQLENAATVIDRLRKYNINADSVAFSGPNEMTVMYDGRITLKLGDMDDLNQKLELAAKLLNDGDISESEAGILDLSIPGKGVFRPDYLIAQDYDGHLKVEYEDAYGTSPSDVTDTIPEYYDENGEAVYYDPEA